MQAVLLYCVVVIAVAVTMILAALIAKLIISRRPPSAAARGMFVYSDGVNTRYIDPIAAMLGLEAHPEFRIDKHLQQAYAGDSEAVRITAQAARDVFGVPVFSQPGKPGLTISESYRLIRAFVDYVETLKKNTRPLPTSAQSSVGPTLPESSAPIEKDLSHSGFSGSEPTPDMASMSATE